MQFLKGIANKTVSAFSGLLRSASGFRSFAEVHPGIVLAFGLLTILFFFHDFVLTELAPYYPRHFDQTAYLSSAYRYADYAGAHGFFTPFKYHFIDQFGSVNLNESISIVGSYLIVLFGEERFNPLLLHFFSYAVLITVSFYSFSSMGGYRGFGYLFAAVILFARFPMVCAGGIFDFRTDFVASCWMGISALLWIWFLHGRKSSLAWLAAFACAVLVFFRILTATYLALPLASLLLVALVSRFRSQKEDQSCKSAGLEKAIAPILTLGGVTVAFILSGWGFIKNYYLSAQLSNAEIEARGADKTWDDALAALSYYPENLVTHHTGFWISIVAMLIGVVSAIVAILNRSEDGRQHSPNGMFAYMFAFLLVVCPIAILTVNPHRAVQVLGVAVIPFLLLGMLPMLKFRARPQSRDALMHIGLPAFVISVLVWGQRLDGAAPFPENRSDAEVLNTVFFDICSSLESLPPEEREFAVLDFLEPLSFGYSGVWFFGKERLGLANPPIAVFPSTILAAESEELLNTFGNVPLAILPSGGISAGKRGYPVLQSMLENYGIVKDELEAGMSIVRTFSFEGVDYDIYRRNSDTGSE